MKLVNLQGLNYGQNQSNKLFDLLIKTSPNQNVPPPIKRASPNRTCLPHSTVACGSSPPDGPLVSSTFSQRLSSSAPSPSKVIAYDHATDVRHARTGRHPRARALGSARGSAVTHCRCDEEAMIFVS